MCNCATDISRRSLGAAVLGAAAVGMLPLGVGAKARRADTDALAVMCIDYRLVHDSVGFFDGDDGPGVGKYDLVALAGASLAAGSTGLFKPTVDIFYQQLGAAWKLHTIRNVVFVDHMGCGAYREEFNAGKPFDPPSLERGHHLDVMRKIAAEFPVRTANMGLPKLGMEFWLFRDPKDGPVGDPERIEI